MLFIVLWLWQCCCDLMNYNHVYVFQMSLWVIGMLGAAQGPSWLSTTLVWFVHHPKSGVRGSLDTLPLLSGAKVCTSHTLVNPFVCPHQYYKFWSYIDIVWKIIIFFSYPVFSLTSNMVHFDPNLQFSMLTPINTTGWPFYFQWCRGTHSENASENWIPQQKKFGANNANVQLSFSPPLVCLWLFLLLCPIGISCCTWEATTGRGF